MKKLLLAAAFIVAPSIAMACPEINLSGTELRFSGEQLYQPRSFSVVAGGDQNISKCGIRNRTDGRPVGFVSRAPDFELRFTGNGYQLEFRVESDCDSILLVNTGAANWYYDDDDNRDSYQDAKIRLSRASDGWYDIWIGTNTPGNCNARLILETF